MRLRKTVSVDVNKMCIILSGKAVECVNGEDEENVVLNFWKKSIPLKISLNREEDQPSSPIYLINGLVPNFGQIYGCNCALVTRD